MKKETQTIEFKQSWHDEYLKWIFGFANSQEGKLSSFFAEQKRMRKAGRSIGTCLCVAEQYRGDGMIRLSSVVYNAILRRSARPGDKGYGTTIR